MTASIFTDRALTILAASIALPLLAHAQEPPAGYEQLLQRGALSSIDQPEYVSVADAEIPDDAWVLGAVIEGQARAYSINLLNSHEIVNDKIGNTAFAAVW